MDISWGMKNNEAGDVNGTKSERALNATQKKRRLFL